MKMEEQKSICLSGRPMGFLLFISRERTAIRPFPASRCTVRKSACLREKTEHSPAGNNGIMGSGEKFLCGGRSEGKILADLPERRDLSGKEGCGQSFIRIREKQKNKGMKDSRYPPPDAAGKGESI